MLKLMTRKYSKFYDQKNCLSGPMDHFTSKTTVYTIFVGYFHLAVKTKIAKI